MKKPRNRMEQNRDQRNQTNSPRLPPDVDLPQNPEKSKQEENPDITNTPSKNDPITASSTYFPTKQFFPTGIDHAANTCPSCGSSCVKIVRTQRIEGVINRNFICLRPQCEARWHTLQNIPVVDKREMGKSESSAATE